MGTLNYFFALNRGTQFSTNFLCFPGSNIFYEVDFKASHGSKLLITSFVMDMGTDKLTAM